MPPGPPVQAGALGSAPFLLQNSHGSGGAGGTGGFGSLFVGVFAGGGESNGSL